MMCCKRFSAIYKKIWILRDCHVSSSMLRVWCYGSLGTSAALTRGERSDFLRTMLDFFSSLVNRYQRRPSRLLERVIELGAPTPNTHSAKVPSAFLCSLSIWINANYKANNHLVARSEHDTSLNSQVGTNQNILLQLYIRVGFEWAVNPLGRANIQYCLMM